jgi:mannose-1-phosphate guanylyltransferase/mannose-6-phosphate isomerase
LLPLARGGRSLLAATLDRVAGLVPPERCLVLTAGDLVAATRKECPAGTQVIGEPVGRNTAPAIAAAAHLFRSQAADASFAVLPSDHAIDDDAAFAGDLERAFATAERDAVLVTFGIRPTRVETGFGYIHRGARLADRVFRVAGFTEKPAREKAERFLASGEYWWNSGMFVWRAGVFLDALEAGRPALAASLHPLAGVPAGRFEQELARVLPGCESISVDFAVLEQAPNVVVLEARFDWDDLGSWHAWARRQPRDGRGNVVFGDAVAVDCDDCIVVGEGGIAAALKLRDMVVVHVHGATLACGLAHTDDVRRVSEAVRARSAR